MKKIITLFTIVFCLNAKAQFVAIPDSNFVHYLKSIVQPAFKGDSLDTNHILVTTTTHSIICNNRSIQDLTGVNYFKSLRYLDFSGNHTFYFLPALPDSLLYLNCNKVYNLPNLSSFPISLKYLYCYGTGITSLPTLPDSLIVLDCGFNNLTTLPALPNKLTYLSLTNNVIFTTLPSLPASLKTLICDSNGIVSLPALPNSLEFLSCGMNVITDLPVLPGSLGYLNCLGNLHLTSLPNLPNSIQYLDCSYDSIFCFPIFPNSITSFSIDPNPYTCLPNYISAMNSTDLAVPLCSAGNSNSCPTTVEGISQISNLNTKISIYPNPSNDNFFIETNSTDKQTLQVFDVTGRLVLTQPITGKANIDASNLPNGIYNVSLIENEGIINKRVLIAR